MLIRRLPLCWAACLAFLGDRVTACKHAHLLAGHRGVVAVRMAAGIRGIAAASRKDAGQLLVQVAVECAGAAG